MKPKKGELKYITKIERFSTVIVSQLPTEVLSDLINYSVESNTLRTFLLEKNKGNPFFSEPTYYQQTSDYLVGVENLQKLSLLACELLLKRAQFLKRDAALIKCQSCLGRN